MPSARLYRNPAFVVFWSARTISFAGTGITSIVLPVLVYRLTGSPSDVAALTLLETGPYIVFGLVAGVFADRLDRKKMMAACNGAAALLLATVPAAAAIHRLTLAQVFVVTFGIGTMFVWFDAANFGSVPALVDRGQLPAALSLIASSGTLALLVGPAVGGALLTVVAPSYALGFDAASYVISGLLLASIRRPFQRPRHVYHGIQRIRSDIGDGLRFLWRQPIIRTMTLSVFCACLSWGGSGALLVVYASRALHLAHADVRLGLLYSAGELGGLISLVAVPALVKRPGIGRVMAAFLAANGVALALVAVAPSYDWALLLYCGYELVYLMVTSTGVTVRQMLSPDDMRARVNTAGRLIAFGGQPVGAVLGGILAEFFPIRVTFALLALGAAAGAALAGWACRGSGPLAAVALSCPPPGSL
jgi:MFS family permease